MEQLTEQLFSKIKTLNECIWEGKIDRPRVDAWLQNFADDQAGSPSERLHLLYLLQKFMYFGNKQIRELLKALYRDLYKYPIVEGIRLQNGNTIDADFVSKAFHSELLQTRFLGMGNPSESGYYLLYFFRQENRLPKTLFIHSHQIFKRYAPVRFLSFRRTALGFPSVKRYVFIDDLCGSGTQAIDYSEQILRDLKKLNRSAEISYYTLFATTAGLKEVRTSTLFDKVECIFELDETFKCFSADSRYFRPPHASIDKQFAEDTCTRYGKTLFPHHPVGYKNGQLLLGLHHNTPDNTLPVFWYDEPGNKPWVPIFRRYPKYYG